MKNKGLSTKLEFEFEDVGEVPLIDFETKLKKKKVNSEINILKKKKKHGKDSSTNKELF